MKIRIEPVKVPRVHSGVRAGVKTPSNPGGKPPSPPPFIVIAI